MNADELFHTYPVFYTTISDTLENIKETNVEVPEYCFVFTGRLNNFGTIGWEELSLPYYIRFIQECVDKNIKVTCKFIVYDPDEFTSGKFNNKLSGYGNVYEQLFNTIKNSEDINRVDYPSYYLNTEYIDTNDYENFVSIVKWLERLNIDHNSLSIKKTMFEEYCKNVFHNLLHKNIYFYYVNNSEVVDSVQKVTENKNIKSIYAFAQHCQVGSAYKKYPNMFDDLHDNSIIIKVRYDGYYPGVNPTIIKNLFYYMSINEQRDRFKHTHLSGSKQEYENFDIYSEPTVLYAPIWYGESKLKLHYVPYDVSMVFNKKGIIDYATFYTSYFINLVSSLYDQRQNDFDDNHFTKMSSNIFGFNVHTSLGKFFKTHHFNIIEYDNPNMEKLFGEVLRFVIYDKDSKKVGEHTHRQLSNITNGIFSDSDDDYKLRWYNGYENIKATFDLIEQLRKKI